MKKTILVILFSLGISSAFSQAITYADFRSLIPYLQAEDWKSAYAESAKLLKSSSNEDSSDFKAIVVYINIFSAAGMVSVKQMSFEDLEKNVMKFRGQRIIMSAHPLTTRDGALNTLKFSMTDTTKEAFTSATNLKGTNIFCFEYFSFNEKINVEDFENSVVRCGGVLDKIEINPRHSAIWILRLRVTNAFARKAG